MNHEYAKTVTRHSPWLDNGGAKHPAVSAALGIQGRIEIVADVKHRALVQTRNALRRFRLHRHQFDDGFIGARDDNCFYRLNGGDAPTVGFWLRGC
jgi:hypothetical protein